MRRLALILAVLAASLGAFGAASAQAASPWTLTNLNLGDGETIFGLTCEPSGFCIGVGQEGVVIQSTAPTAGAGAWTVGHISPAENLNANLRGISCPSPTLCVAVDFSGGVWTTTDPGAGAASWAPTRIPKAKSLFAVTCQSTTACTLVGAGGLVVNSSNPTGGNSSSRGSARGTAIKSCRRAVRFKACSNPESKKSLSKNTIARRCRMRLRKSSASCSEVP